MKSRSTLEKLLAYEKQMTFQNQGIWGSALNNAPERRRENVIPGTDCGLGGRVHAQIGWAKLRALRHGAAIASKKLWS